MLLREEQTANATEGGHPGRHPQDRHLRLPRARHRIGSTQHTSTMMTKPIYRRTYFFVFFFCGILFIVFRALRTSGVLLLSSVCLSDVCRQNALRGLLTAQGVRFLVSYNMIATRESVFIRLCLGWWCVSCCFWFLAARCLARSLCGRSGHNLICCHKTCLRLLPLPPGRMPLGGDRLFAVIWVHVKRSP